MITERLITLISVIGAIISPIVIKVIEIINNQQQYKLMRREKISEYLYNLGLLEPNINDNSNFGMYEEYKDGLKTRYHIITKLKGLTESIKIYLSYKDKNKIQNLFDNLLSEVNRNENKINDVREQIYDIINKYY